MLEREIKGIGRGKWAYNQGSLFKEEPSEQKPKSSGEVSQGKTWEKGFQVEKKKAKT